MPDPAVSAKGSAMVISGLAREVEEATAAYNDADKAYRSASHSRTAAVNRLNDAQKAFDKAVKATKDSAPFDSEWRQAERVFLPVEP